MSGNGGAFYPSLFCLAANTQVPNLQSSTALLKLQESQLQVCGRVPLNL